MAEQTVLVTGATDGLGRAVAGALAAQGATVLLHGRDDERGRRALAEIRAESGNDRLGWYRADLASLAEVRDLAERLRADLGRLDVLVNNAGVGSTLPGDGRRMQSADGHELRLAVNYLAPFLLTRLLLPLLTASAPARVVNVSSAGQHPLDLDDVMLERSYDGARAYRQSKLAQVMDTFDLAAELAGTGVTVNALHPASRMPTKIVLAAWGRAENPLEDGVRAVLRLVADPALEGVSGRYFDGTVEADPHPQAGDAAAREALRRLATRLTGLPA